MTKTYIVKLLAFREKQLVAFPLSPSALTNYTINQNKIFAICTYQTGIGGHNCAPN